MRKLLLVLLLSLFCATPLHAEESASYPGLLVDDVKYVFTAPSRWEKEEWQNAGLATLAVIGTSLVADKPVRDFMRKQDQGSTFWLETEKFGREYAVVTVGAFFLAGTVGGNDTALAVAQDSLTTSIIASGIIATSFKIVVGRSRPDQNQDIYHAVPFSDANSSFFSGHATQAFSVASVIASHYEAPWIQASAYGVATLAALARPYHDRHYASDIVAAAIVGTWVGKSVVEHNRGKRGSNIAVAPEMAADYLGVRVSQRF